MPTLLLRLAGPMQSWGTQSRFPVRDTGQEPSKSGVIGLIAAALGRARHIDVSDLAGLLMGVRVDKEGRVMKDYQTSLNVIRANRSRSTDAVVSNRYYLADADFLVGLESENGPLLQEIHQAVANPHWPLCLGRKAFPLGQQVFVPGGFQPDASLKHALSSFPINAAYLDQRARVRVVMEQTTPTGIARMDQPLSFQPRRHTTRFVRTEWMPIEDMVSGEK